MSPRETPVGVLLMTYGSPSSLEDVPRYLRSVRGGRDADEELITEFRRRYQVIGWSPLIEITTAQAAALETALGGSALVRPAMRFSPPSIADGLADLADRGVRDVVGIILSPQYSPLLMGGYARDVEAARAQLGERAPNVTVAGAWHMRAPFLDAVADRVREAIARLPEDERSTAPILLTAHSLPRRVAENERDYLDQLTTTATEIANRAGVDRSRWTFCWQSAGHEPGEWMKPDFADLMPALAREGHRSVVVAPVQFLADHLEILYDVEVAAREQAEESGMRFERIESLNMHPGLIRALVDVVDDTVRVPVEAA
jgi:ferrochelatase